MKHPVTKQKRSASRGKKQYFVFAQSARKKLLAMTPVIACPHCKQPKLNHRVCPECGFYGDKEVIKKAKKVENITKVKV
jgi:large subunit ribosomal protein L32